MTDLDKGPWTEVTRSNVQEVRDGLIEEVVAGLRAPGDAEAAALAEGIPPLVNRADPALFDPMSEPFWSHTMALAWIVWRTPEHVREHWTEARATEMEWKYADPRNSPSENAPARIVNLDTREPSSIEKVKLLSMWGECVLPFDAAASELIHALKTGAIVAWQNGQEVQRAAWARASVDPGTDTIGAFDSLVFDGPALTSRWPSPRADAVPVIASAPTQARRTVASASVSLEEAKKALTACNAHMRLKGKAPLIKAEVENLLSGYCSQAISRGAATGLPNSKRRPKAFLAIRDNDLEEARGFLANWFQRD